MSETKFGIFTISVFLFSRYILTLALECIKVDRCSCKFDDGSGTIDLSNIGKRDGLPL